jgi:hypothetical protein
MSPRVLYAGLCVLGTVLPYSQFIPFLNEHGLDVRLLLQQLFANPVSSFFATDVIVSALVLLVFVTIEGRRLGMRHRWLSVVALLTVGVSLALPLFLYQREEHLNRSTPAEVATR